MFQGDHTKDHSSSHEGSFSLSFFVSLHLHFNPFFFGFLFISLFVLFFRVLLRLFFFFERLDFWWVQLYFQDWDFFAARLLKTDAFVILRVSLFRHLPSSVESDPWSGFKKKISRFKRGDYWIIFYTSEWIIKDGHFSSQI